MKYTTYMLLSLLTIFSFLPKPIVANESEWVIDGVPIGGVVDEASILRELETLFYYGVKNISGDQSNNVVFIGIGRNIFLEGRLKPEFTPGADREGSKILSELRFSEDKCNIEVLSTGAGVDVYLVAVDFAQIGEELSAACVAYGIALAIGINEENLTHRSAGDIFFQILKKAYMYE